MFFKLMVRKCLGSNLDGVEQLVFDYKIES